MAIENVPDAQSGDKARPRLVIPDDSDGPQSAGPLAVRGGKLPQMDRATYFGLLEEVRQISKQAAYEVGRRLRQIRDGEGWRWSYRSFGALCEFEVGSRPRAYQLIDYATVIDAALLAMAEAGERPHGEPLPLPPERQVREVLKVFGHDGAAQRLRAALTSGDPLAMPGNAPFALSTNSAEGLSTMVDKPGREFEADEPPPPLSQKELAKTAHDHVLAQESLTRGVRRLTEHKNSKKILRSALQSQAARDHALEVARSAIAAWRDFESAINLLDEPS